MENKIMGTPRRSTSHFIAGLSCGVNKLCHGEIGTMDQASERSSGDFLMIGDRERRGVSLSNENDVAAALPNLLPTQ